MSTWRFRLQRASFRGVPFEVRQGNHEIGRRNVTHEYPLRDLPYVEDLGRRARRFNVQALVLGGLYFSRRDLLIRALEAPGPGLLVHPWLGQLVVSVESARITESTESGGSAAFDIAFVETDANQYPNAEKSWAAQINDWVNNLLATVENAFTEAWSVVNEASQVVDAGINLVGGAAALLNDTLSEVTKTLAVGNRLSAVQRQINALDDNAADLIAVPQNLYDELTGAISSLGGAFDWNDGRYSPARQNVQTSSTARPSTPAHREDEDRAVATLIDQGQQSLARGLQTLQEWPATLAAVPTTTAARLQQAANQTALGDLIQQVALTEECRLAIWRRFDSCQAAQTYAYDLATRLDAAAVASAHDPVYDALTGLRVAITQALLAQAANLATVVSYTAPDTLPALVVAWRLYDDARRDADLIARNRLIIRHPGFVPGGVALEVLNA